ncbi:MAG: CPBP family intramembrane metalloprotease [Spirochaetales bacterium]|nr:CPBP family intramembrane metalloprotease [Spirochaetales bacterium]
MKLGKEFALLFSVMFLPGILTQTGAVNPSSWDGAYYTLTLLAVAIPQILLVVYITELRTPGFSRRLGWRAPRMADVITLAMAAALLFGALTVLTVVGSLMPEQSALWEPAVKWSFTRYELLPLVVLSSIAVGYREEIFYRAYMIARGEEIHLHPAVVVGGSSLLFAAGHLYQGWAGFIVSFVIGATFGAVFAWRRSLHGIAIAHGLYNTLVLLVSTSI